MKHVVELQCYTGAREPFYNGGIKIKNQVLSYVDFHPTFWNRADCLDRWYIFNDRPQFQILGGQLIPLTRPSRAPYKVFGGPALTQTTCLNIRTLSSIAISHRRRVANMQLQITISGQSPTNGKYCCNHPARAVRRSVFVKLKNP